MGTVKTRHGSYNTGATADGICGVIKGISMVLASGAFQGFLKRDQRVGWMGVDTLTNYKEKRMRIVVSEYSFEFTSFSTCWRFKN